MRNRNNKNDLFNESKYLDESEIIALLESPEFCRFQKERNLCDGNCGMCKKKVMDALEMMGKGMERNTLLCVKK